jgi:hypothetical protein
MATALHAIVINVNFGIRCAITIVVNVVVGD